MFPLSSFCHERWNLTNSEFNEVFIKFTCVPSIRIVVSSANSVVNYFSETPAKSLIYKMNNNPGSKPLAVHRWQPPVGH